MLLLFFSHYKFLIFDQKKKKTRQILMVFISLNLFFEILQKKICFPIQNFDYGILALLWTFFAEEKDSFVMWCWCDLMLDDDDQTRKLFFFVCLYLVFGLLICFSVSCFFIVLNQKWMNESNLKQFLPVIDNEWMNEILNFFRPSFSIQSIS